MRQWGGRSLSNLQSIILLSDSKQKREVIDEVAKEIKAQLPQNGVLTTLEYGSNLSTLSNVDGVISYGINCPDSTLLQCLSTLKPGGFIVLCEPIAERGPTSDEDASDKLLLSGFVNAKIAKIGEYAEISAAKPDWEVGASQKLTLKRPAPSNGVSAQDAKNIWSLSAATDDQDLIDEDSLLDETDRTAKPSTKPDDCEVGKTGKKACKNCTCGRADMPDEEEAPKPKLTKEMIENPGVGSSCGSCSLGDAYRCAGCPYRGLPAFKVGEKITLPDNYMADDI